MGKVIWNNKILLEFEESHKHLLLDSCKLKNIKYILNEENIVLFPALYDKTIIISISNIHEKFKNEIQALENSFTLEGAVVIISNDNKIKENLKYLDTQILLSFSHKDDSPDLTIYLPFVKNKTSLSITKKFLKYLSLWENHWNYKVASFWEKIFASKYWSCLWENSFPTIVLELGISNISNKAINSLKSSLVKSIIEEMGEMPTSEEINTALTLIEKAKETIGFETKIKNEDQIVQLSALLEKINYQENELNTLKMCYKETENELKKIKEANENEIVKKSIATHSQQEITLQNVKATEVSSKTKARSKNKRSKSKKIYFPIKGQNEKDKSTILYSRLAYPIKIPECGPVYQFQRPQQGTNNNITAPSYLNPGHLTKHNITNHSIPKSINTLKSKAPPAQTFCQDIIENLKGLDTAQEK